jgi:hypothetical protein
MRHRRCERRPRVEPIEHRRDPPEEPTMTTATQRTLAERGTALALAVAVTLALLGGIDRLATHGVSADALLARHQAGSAIQS